MGLAFEQTAAPTSLLKHAAKQAFWRLSKDQLSKLATDLGLQGTWTSTLQLCSALVASILAPIEEDEVASIVAQRGIAPPNQFPAELTTEVLEDAIGASEAQAFKDLGQMPTQHPPPPYPNTKHVY